MSLFHKRLIDEKVLNWSEGAKMLKVVVYGYGWGGELVANYLEAELGIVEVVRVVDWLGDHNQMDMAEMMQRLEKDLCKYLNVVDVIVLGDYRLLQIAGALCKKYPGQKFVTMGVSYAKILRTRNYPANVVLLADDLEKNEDVRDNLRRELEHSTLVIPDCSGWEELINQDMMTPEILRTELAWDFVVQLPGAGRRRGRRMFEAPRKVTMKEQMESEKAQNTKLPQEIILPEDSTTDRQRIARAIQRLNLAQKEVAVTEKETTDESRKLVAELQCRRDVSYIKPDVVLILNTSFWEIEGMLEEVFGWEVRVVDFREKLLRDTCAALKLRGVDGRRPK